ncbi:MAG: AAA family ATPase [Gemmatimonadales bacterium]
MLRLQTLGGLQLLNDSGSPVKGRRMVLAVLAWLARSRGHQATRDRLIDVFWTRSDPAAARHSLRQALTELRSLLPDGSLTIEGEEVAVDRRDLSLDLARFEEAITRRDWLAATAEYQGPFLRELEDIGGTEWRTWVEAERGGAERMAASAFEGAIEAATNRGAWPDAISLAERWTEVAPGREAPEIVLIRTLLMAGSREQAAGRYAVLAARLTAEGEEPSAELQRIARQLPPPVPSPAGARGLMTPDLVGREPAFTVLTSAWYAVRAGGSSLLVLEGEEGSGKTRLLEEFTRSVRAREPSLQVITVRAYRAESDQPSGALGSLLDELASAKGLPAAAAEDLLSLSAVSPAIRRRFGKLAGEPTLDRGLALTRVISEVVAESPILLILDDADQADPESLKALAALARRLPRHMFLVFAIRPPAPGSSFLADLPSESIIRSRLTGLGNHDAVALVRSMGPITPASAEQLAEAGVRDLGGNPGNLRALVMELADTGILALDANGAWELAAPLTRPVALPEGAQIRAHRLMHEISPAARDLLHLAAASGNAVPRSTLVRASGLAEESLRDALGELTSRRLLRPTDGTASRFEFSSEAARRAVWDTLAGDQRADFARRLQPAPPGTGRRRRAAGAVIGLAAILSIIGIAVIQPDDPAHVEVLLADIRSSTGDQDLDRTLALVAGIELQESRRIRLVPRTRIREALVRMGRRGADSILDEHLAREIAEREDVPWVLSLDAVHAGGKILLTGQLLVPRTGAVDAAASETADSEAEVLDAMGRLLRQIRRRLGELPGDSTATSGLPRVSTHSIAALREFASGRDAWTNRKYLDAREAWQRAVALDSGFALAWASLADEAYRANDAPLGNQFLERAISLSGTLTPREQLALRAQRARHLGTTADAIAASKRLAEAYPGRDAWYSLGTTLMQARQCDQALPALAQSLVYDGRFTNAHINRATCFQFLQRFDSAVVAYQQAGTLDSTALLWSNVGEEYGSALRMAGRRSEAEAHFQRVIARGEDGIKARGHRQLAWMAMAEGRFGAAIRSAQEAVRLVGLVDEPVGMFRARLVLARALLGSGDSVSARREFEAAWAARPKERLSSGFLVPAAHLASRLALRTRAVAAAEEAVAITRPGVVSDDTDRATALAMLELARGNPARAVGQTDAHWPPQPGARWGFLEAVRAEALVGNGQLDSALALYRQLSAAPWVGWEAEDVSVRADLEIARLATRLGHSTEAITAVDRFLDKWKGADQTAPELLVSLALRETILQERTR